MIMVTHSITRIVIVARIHGIAERDLSFVAQAAGARGGRFGPREGRQEQSSQNGDYGNDDKEFDQRE